MCVACRRLCLEDEAGVLDLLAEVFGDNRQQLRQEWRAADPVYLERTCVAVAPDGTLVGAASYAVRHRRDPAGRPGRSGT